MSNERRQNSGTMSEGSASHIVSLSSLDSGPGEVSLKGTSKFRYLALGQQGRNPAKTFNPHHSMDPVPYNQPQSNYTQPSRSVQASGTSRNIRVEKITVKDG